MSRFQRVSAFRNAIEKIEEAKETKSITEIALNEIENPNFHDRTTFSEEDINSLAENISQVGLINPVILRKKINGKYERIAGFRRIESVKKLGWNKIPAIVLDIDDKSALLIMLSENIQRENLNPYDEVLSLLQLIAVNLELSEENVKSLLYKIKNYISGNIDNLSEEEKEIKTVIDNILSKTGKYNFQGFINRLRVLNLNPSIINALREKKIQYSHAVQLNKVKDENILLELIKETYQNKLSKEDIIQKVKDNSINKPKIDLFSDFNKKIKLIKKLPKDKLNLIEEKMKEILSLLS
ncbi:MAG: ParB/RepB/Spo0J family partition protein [Candidatus Sericytochromatia bacterium]